jgi:hypothetical protein
MVFNTVGAERMRIDSSGNVMVGVSSTSVKFQVNASADTIARFYGNTANNYIQVSDNNGTNSASYGSIAGGNAYIFSAGYNAFFAGSAERMRIDSSGRVLVGATATSSYFDGSLNVFRSGNIPLCVKTDTSGAFVSSMWNSATTGDNAFIIFGTEASFTFRGSITYNRTAGLTAYNTTSDYRAKDIIGSVLDSGEVIDSVPVYMGKMKGATQARPMFIAHETPDYAHTGEKDAVDKDGNPVYQQMDASSLVPVLWAEIQSLRKRVAQLESK